MPPYDEPPAHSFYFYFYAQIPFKDRHFLLEKRDCLRSSCAWDDLWHPDDEDTHQTRCVPAGHDDGRFGGEMWPFVGTTQTPPLDAVGQQIAWPSCTSVQFEETEPRKTQLRHSPVRWFRSQPTLWGRNVTNCFFCLCVCVCHRRPYKAM